MKKSVLALFLALTMMFTACSPFSPKEKEALPNLTQWKDDIPDRVSLGDSSLLGYVENLVYRETIMALDSEDYVVESVTATYVSKEYLEEVAYNSVPNLYFGYGLEELNEVFEGAPYVFTLGENGKTQVQKLDEPLDIHTRTLMKNVAIGAGVILICVTVSALSGGLGLPAVSTIFAASAKTGAMMALTSGGLGAVSAGIVRGVQTGDFDEALEAAALSGSEGFKWGAVSGAISGGLKETLALKAATKSGLTMGEVATIQKESTLPTDVIAQFHSMDEYLVYKKAGLKPMIVNGKTALVQDIDLNYKSRLSDGKEVTNLMRMQKGQPPIDPATGKAYQLHHVGQKADGTLAILTEGQHQKNGAILNIFGKETEIDRAAFQTTRREFWKYLGNVVFGNVPEAA